MVPLLFAGRLGDVLGQRRMFCLGVAIFGVGAIVCAIAPQVEVLIAARAVQGVGASLQMPQSMSVINRIFARERRGRALGVWGVIGSIAALVGPLAGGFLVGNFGWQAAFWVHIPFVVLAIVLALAVGSVGSTVVLGGWVPNPVPAWCRRLRCSLAASRVVDLGDRALGTEECVVHGFPPLQVFAFVLGGYIMRSKTILNINAQFIMWQVTDMT